MLLKTLASRVAVVQATVTLVALVAVACGTLLTVNWLLTRQLQGELLASISPLGIAFDEVSDPAAHPEWLAYEADEQLVAGARLEVRGPNGEPLAAVGRALELPLQLDGCKRDGALRVCGQ